jgi:hypothetical protein
LRLRDTLADMEAEELHPGLPREVLRLLLVEAVDVLRPLVLLEGGPVAVQLVEDAGISVAFDRMAGIDQVPGSASLTTATTSRVSASNCSPVPALRLNRTTSPYT